MTSGAMTSGILRAEDLSTERLTWEDVQVTNDKTYIMFMTNSPFIIKPDETRRLSDCILDLLCNLIFYNLLFTFLPNLIVGAYIIVASFSGELFMFSCRERIFEDDAVLVREDLQEIASLGFTWRRLTCPICKIVSLFMLWRFLCKAHCCISCRSLWQSRRIIVQP